MIEQALLQKQDRLIFLKNESELVSKASIFLQSLSDKNRVEILDKISGLVTEALQTVKDRSLAFNMRLSVERSQPDLKFFIVDTTTGKEFDITTSCGGGIADLVAFPLRISLLLKWPKPISRILILDENFKFVSVQDQELLADFIKYLAEKLQLQIILVTHSATLSNRANRVFEITKLDGVSQASVRG